MEAAPLQYRVPEDRIASLIEALEAGLSLLEEPEARVTSTLLDTADLRLATAGFRLHEEVGDQGTRLVLTDPADPRPLTLPLAGATPRFLRELPPSRLRTRLEPVAEGRALLPRVQVEGQRRTFRVLDGFEKSVLWLRLERGQARDPLSDTRHPLADRLWLGPVLGYPEPLAHARALIAGLALEPEARTPLEEALARIDQPLVDTPDRPPLPFTADDDAGAVLHDLLLVPAARFQRALPGVKGDLDPRFLTDALNALGQINLLLGRMGAWIEGSAGLLAHAAWLGETLDAAADAGRFLAHLDRQRHRFAPRFREGLTATQAFLSRRRVERHRAMVRTINGPRARGFFNDLGACLEGLPPPGVTPTIQAAARRAIWGAFKDVIKTGRRLRPRSAPAEVERMHRYTQELRELMATFAPAFDAAELDPLRTRVDEVAGLTNALVAPDTQGARMLELVQEARTEDPAQIDALLIIGMLAEDLHTRRNRAWLRFASRFEDLSAKPSIHAFLKLLVRPAR